MTTKPKTTEPLLDPENNRLEFFKHLMPDEGYEVDFAIGTTYSLDLKTALCVPLSMEMEADIDSVESEKEVCKFTALKKMADKIALFCNVGQISSNRCSVDKLHILMENMIFPVTVTNNGKNASFHSKFWLIRFKNENDIRFRLIVLSRNLTANKSWDVIYCEDSKKSGSKTDVIKNLQGYISYLANQLPKEEETKKRKMKDIKKELDGYSFDGLKEFLAFYPKPENEDYKRPVPDFLTSVKKNEKIVPKEGNILVISPFISKTTIENITNHFKIITLITREDELGKIKDLKKNNEKTLNVFIPNDGIGIHAKVYVTEKDIYLGSFNASENAVNNNVETLVHIQREGAYGIIKSDLIVNKNFFTEVSHLSNADETTDPNETAEKILKDFLSLNPTAELKENTLTIKTGGKFSPDLPFSIEPLDAGIEPIKWEKNTNSVDFKNLSEKDQKALSKFYKVTIKKNEKEAIETNEETFSRIVKIDTEGLASQEDRAQNVINDYIKEHPEELKNYISSWFGIYAGTAEPYEIILEAACREHEKDEFQVLEEKLEEMKATFKENDEYLKKIKKICDLINIVIEAKYPREDK